MESACALKDSLASSANITRACQVTQGRVSGAPLAVSATTGRVYAWRVIMELIVEKRTALLVSKENPAPDTVCAGRKANLQEHALVKVGGLVQVAKS